MLSLLVSLLTLLVLSANGQAPSYAPKFVTCPAGPLVSSTGSPLSSTQTLESREAAYQQNRWNNVLRRAYLTYLGNQATDVGYNSTQSSIIVKNQPRIAFACSGGGLRAAQYCAGAISALDARYSGSVAPVLQLSTSMSGLSGGSWAVTSFALQNLGPTSLYDIVMGNNGSPGWKLDLDLLTPNDGNPVDLAGFEASLTRDLAAKAAAGFPISFIDYWARALGHHFFNGTTRANFFSPTAPNDNGLLFESIKYTPQFQSFKMPYPLIVTTSRVSVGDQFQAGANYIPLKNTVFEISPYSFGSFDSSLAARVPTELMGTFGTNGNSGGGKSCVNWFDSASFVIGASAALFNALETQLRNAVVNPVLATLLGLSSGVVTSQTNTSDELVAQVPNSFHSYVPTAQGATAFESSNNNILQLTDGGLNGENIPLNPLLVKIRALDTIFALDGSFDTTKIWPNGTSLIATAARVAQYSNGYTNFPPIPSSQDDFVNQGLNLRPVFFGCDVRDANVSKTGNYPIVIYLPNAAIPSATYYTNTSTYQTQYAVADTQQFLDASRANGIKGFQNTTAGQTTDPNYPLALKCAIVDRARQRAGIGRSATCRKMFARYCWSPAVAASLAAEFAKTGGGVPSTV